MSDWVYSVRWAGGKLVAVGENGLILTSDDGVSWNKRNSGTTEWLNDVTFAQNTWWVAGSAGLILTSPDLVTWTMTRSITSKSLYSAVTDGEQLIMAGLEGVIIRNQLVPISSPVNFVAMGETSAGRLFLFDGVVDQQFELEETPDLNTTWMPAASLEILSTAGTLIYEHPADASRSKFFRTRLLAP